jgi:aspartyl-tRNA(Asn)/glutamyl-tRNA(Gln) amidotransferase subunit A
MDAWLADTDVLVMPTCPIVAPTQAEVASPDDFARKNAMALRNTSVWNFFDCCAISLPIPGASLPAGLMLVARNGRDRELFAAATAAERALA